MEKKTILLVDDDEDLNTINKAALERAGFIVLTAINSAQAMKIATADPIHVAVLDVMMGSPIEGFVLARAMRQNEKTKSIPLLMLTSINNYSEEIGAGVRFTDRDRDSRWLPVDRFLDKPVKTEDLIQVVRTLSGAWTFSRSA